MCYESESKLCSKTTISMFNSLYICWNLDVTFTLCQARSHGSIQGKCPKFFCAQKIFFQTYTVIKTKILPP